MCPWIVVPGGQRQLLSLDGVNGWQSWQSLVVENRSAAPRRYGWTNRFSRSLLLILTDYLLSSSFCTFLSTEDLPVLLQN